MATKKAEYYYNRWLHSNDTELWQVYNSWSSAKEKALEWCKNKYHETNGTFFRIISRNTFGFSVAWLSADWMTLYVETPKNSYTFDVSDL